MARQLWLLRHAEAEPHGSRADADRRLTARGEQQARAAGLALARINVDFELVLFSPRVRARQTAELAAEAWGESQRERLEVHAPLSGGLRLAGAREAIAGVSDGARVLLVGHEPDLSLIAGEATGASMDLKKGGLAVVRLEGASGELVILMRPRELALLGGVPADAN